MEPCATHILRLGPTPSRVTQRGRRSRHGHPRAEPSEGERVEGPEERVERPEERVEGPEGRVEGPGRHRYPRAALRELGGGPRPRSPLDPLGPCSPRGPLGPYSPLSPGSPRGPGAHARFGVPWGPALPGVRGVRALRAMRTVTALVVGAVEGLASERRKEGLECRPARLDFRGYRARVSFGACFVGSMGSGLRSSWLSVFSQEPIRSRELRIRSQQHLSSRAFAPMAPVCTPLSIRCESLGCGGRGWAFSA